MSRLFRFASLTILGLGIFFFAAAPQLDAQAAASPSAQAALAKWKSLQFLLGTWEARTVSSKPQVVGTYSFQPELNGTVLARHSSQDSCKGPADFSCDHHDLLYIFRAASGDGFQAIYFDNEGHVIHYNVMQPSPVSVIFQSEPGPGPQFRLTYQLAGDVLHGKFEVAPPGQTTYQSYLEWQGGRK
jgi:hypothetical protein